MFQFWIMQRWFYACLAACSLASTANPTTYTSHNKTFQLIPLVHCDTHAHTHIDTHTHIHDNQELLWQVRVSSNPERRCRKKIQRFDSARFNRERERERESDRGNTEWWKSTATITTTTLWDDPRLSLTRIQRRYGAHEQTFGWVVLENGSVTSKRSIGRCGLWTLGECEPDSLMWDSTNECSCVRVCVQT